MTFLFSCAERAGKQGGKLLIHLRCSGENERRVRKMGIVYDPELYRATEKDFAPYPLPECSRSPFQTWFAAIELDNGYYVNIMFTFAGDLRAVIVSIVDNAGQIVLDSMQFFDEEECKYRTDGYELHMGENFLHGDFPTLVIHIADPERQAGTDLVVEFQCMPTKWELPDGVGIGRIKVPSMPVSIAWFFVPRCKISGTLTLEGKVMDVSGHGWTDHQYGTDEFFTQACQYNYWVSFPLGDEILTVFDTMGGAAQGYRPMKWLWNFKDGKIYSYENNAAYYVFADDIDEGDTIPKKLMFVFEGDRIRGKVTCDFKMLIQKHPIEAPPLKAILNRSVYNCHVELEIDGKKYDKYYERTIEVTYTLDPDPSTVQRAAPPVFFEPDVVPQHDPEAALNEEGPSRLSIKSKLREVMEDPEGNAVMERHLPGITNDPNTKRGYGMKLSMIFKMPQSGLSKEEIAQIDRELRAIK